MPDFPEWVHHDVEYAEKVRAGDQDAIEQLRQKLSRFKSERPEVSILIPAYNEEDSIGATLSSLANQHFSGEVELWVCNNNSTDRTQEILNTLGVNSILEQQQGISYARQALLEQANGEVVFSCDSDSLYPPHYLQRMLEAFRKHQGNNCAIYAKYRFIPSEGNSRSKLFWHEQLSDLAIAVRHQRQPAANVLGYNMVFARQDAIAVGGYKHELNREETRRAEDGWLTYEMIGNTGKGVRRITDPAVVIWTSDRRLMEAGSMGKAVANRIKAELGYLNIFKKP